MEDMLEMEKKQYINIEKGKQMFDNDIDIYLEIAAVFCKNAFKQIDIIESAIEKEDYASYGREVHTLKSLAGNLGADSLAELATEHDSAYKRKDYLFLKKSYKEVIELYKNVIHELDRICMEYSDSTC